MNVTTLRCPNCGGVVSRRNEVEPVIHKGVEYHPCTDRCKREFKEKLTRLPVSS